ncbi:calcium-binding protein [Azospirillum himalayense]|uniref:Ca2+-binding RTX toxin-like protein n=1 Tax=Azospirillum himalayense TaxID=654847 RepID=A0ABW0G5R3_9PROT
MTGLTLTDIEILTKYANDGARINYFNYLATRAGNDGYGKLALGVVRNDNQPGAVANHYMRDYAADHGVSLDSKAMENFGVDLIRNDLAIRTQYMANNRPDLALNLPISDVEYVHDTSLSRIGLSGYAWTIKTLVVKAREVGGDTLAEQVYHKMLDDNNIGADRVVNTFGTTIDLYGLKVPAKWLVDVGVSYSKSMFDIEDYSNPNFVNGYTYDNQAGQWYHEITEGRIYLHPNFPLVKDLNSERQIRLERTSHPRHENDNSPNVSSEWLVGDSGEYKGIHVANLNNDVINDGFVVGGAAGDLIISAEGKAEAQYRREIEEALHKPWEAFGSSLGRAIGTIIADGDDVKALALSSIIQTFGQEIGWALNNTNSQNSFAEMANEAFGGFSNHLGANLAGNSLAAVGSLMVGQLLDGVGLDEFSGGMISTTLDYAFISPSVNAALVNLEIIDAGGKITGNPIDNIENMFTDVDGNFSFDGLAGALGSFAGSFLARSLVQAQTEGGSIGGTIGGIIGSFLPIPIPGVGTFIGTVFGTAIGNLIGNPSVGPNAQAFLGNDASGHYIVTSAAADNNGDVSIARAIGDTAAAVLNDVLRVSGGHAGAGGAYGYLRGWYYNDREGDYRGSSFFATPDEAITDGVLRSLREANTAGFDQTVLKMISNTSATTLAELYSDLAVAADYKLYLSHQSEIEAAIMAVPDSSFAMGWGLTLARADQLQLDEPLGTWPPPAPVRLVGDIDDSLLYGGGGNDRLDGADGNDDLVAGAGNDILIGGNGNDTMHGEAGNDTLSGGEGDDWLFGGAGQDVLNGGTGTDQVSYESAGSGVSVNLQTGYGTAGDAKGDRYISIENVVGSAYGDFIVGDNGTNGLAGQDGNDTLSGLGGNDYLHGGNGNDSLIGGAGSDRLEGGNGNDALIGDDGNDTMMGGSDQDYLAGGADNDSLVGDDGFDTLVGGTGDDTLFGGGHHDILSGEDGNDTLVGGWGEDTLFGGNHNDVLYGEDGYDLLDGGAGDDNLFGGNHNDTLFGNDGNDTLSGEEGDDHLHGQNGNDTLFGNNGSDWLTGGAGADWLDGGAGWDNVNYNGSWGAVGVDLADGVAWSAEGEGDRLINIEGVQGSQHNDDLRGDNNNNWLHGQGGDDWLFGRGGADILDGGDGFDVANYVDSLTGITVDLRNGAASGGSAQGDQLHNIEGVHGSTYDDHLHGNDVTNWLYGSWGNDWLHGYGSDDSLYGDTGSDSLNGGLGADHLEGGEGSDWAAYMWATTGIAMTLEGNYGWLGEAVGDKFYSIENVLGSEHNDEIHGDWQGNYLVGSGGNDALLGKDGSDTLVGGWGNDYMEGGGHNDTLIGDDGHDYMVGGWGDDYLHGGNNNDTLIGDDGHDLLVGGANEDYLVGGNNNDVLHGEDGYDTLIGGANEDYLHGGGHNDTLVGDDGYDTLVGGWGEDYLHGGGHNDVLHGEDGHDYMVGGWGEDALYGGNHNDTLIGEDGHDTLYGGANEDYLVGGNHNDVLYGEDGYDTLFGGANEDYLHGGGHNDMLIGDDGYDTLVGGWGDDWMSGGGHNDALFGEDGNDAIHGGWGDDNLLGGEGGDWLVGEEGNDGINGGGGYDTAYFAGSRNNHYIHYVSYGHGAIIDATGRNGGDWVWETERLQFDDAVAYFDGSQGWPPLVIDLDGDGLELTDVFESTVRFDMSGDGIADRTGWAAADDGLIVYDLGGDRKITEQAEVVLATHGEAGMTDLEALAHAFDGNKDGWFDANDAHWKDFGVWQDRNQDGVTDDGEFRTLEEVGIARIGLAGEVRAEVVAGNVINAVTRFETVDGREGLIGDVTLYAKSGAEEETPVIAANDDVPELPSLENALHGLTAAMAMFDAQGESRVEETAVITEDAVYLIDDNTLPKAA